ncbi:hypothetical protein HBI56_131490 [Parastagonospora nodorum]|nr:hypothetical protein HBH53_218300 [Parastagonospora nodorum]KAH3996760.1 hypothetical protein HBI10_153410 [Parastagonospora nodorum]KAH4012577.1 hypothetical protein HBI13_188100 [Parastagonospora nodorum]KAH4029585.1 hypothetical protein HBI09_135220 [Parastagonospora nodorum]KAH4047520.1 hypothetical protein HBH49_166280 [Parastagonospora nodorum]
MDISWSIAMNRILDIYGTNSMTREQERNKYRTVLSQDSAKERRDLENEVDGLVQNGRHVRVDPALTWHIDNKQRQREWTEEGARTIIRGPHHSGGTSRRPSLYESDPGLPSNRGRRARRLDAGSASHF